MDWTVDIPARGEYELIFHFTPNKNRATNVPVTVEAGGPPVDSESRRAGRRE